MKNTSSIKLEYITTYRKPKSLKTIIRPSRKIQYDFFNGNKSPPPTNYTRTSSERLTKLSETMKRK